MLINYHRPCPWLRSRINILLLIIFLGVGAIFTSLGCAQREKELFIFCGRGLKGPMDDIKKAFEKNHRITINVIYAGSGNLLETIRATGGGDIFFSGSTDYIKETGDLVSRHQFVALHEPGVCIHKDNPKQIYSFADLAAHGVKLGIANNHMCGLGSISEKIIASSELKEALVKNIIIKVSTINELIVLCKKKELDAAIIWKDMLSWPEAKKLKKISIPSDINIAKEIRVAVLSASKDKKLAGLFADFVTSEGKAIFAEHGFSTKPEMDSEKST